MVESVAMNVLKNCWLSFVKSCVKNHYGKTYVLMAARRHLEFQYRRGYSAFKFWFVVQDDEKVLFYFGILRKRLKLFIVMRPKSTACHKIAFEHILERHIVTFPRAVGCLQDGSFSKKRTFSHALS